jgi:hypothetical protein
MNHITFIFVPVCVKEIIITYLFMTITFVMYIDEKVKSNQSDSEIQAFTCLWSYEGFMLSNAGHPFVQRSLTQSVHCTACQGSNFAAIHETDSQ